MDDTERILVEYVLMIEKELKDADVEDILERALGISRYQRLGAKGWETEYYEILVTYGGPNVWVRTDGLIRASWAGKTAEKNIEDPEVLDKLRQIHEYLDSLQ